MATEVYATFHLYPLEIGKFISLIGAFRQGIKASIQYDFGTGFFECNLEFDSSRDFLIFQNTCSIFSCGKYIP